MSDFILTRLHEVILIVYCLSILLYFIDFLLTNRKANRIAFWLLSFVWILETIFVISYIIEIDRFPVLTLTEGIYFYSWFILTASVVINHFKKMDFGVFFINIVGFISIGLIGVDNFQTGTHMDVYQLLSELLIIHITLAIISYGFYSLSFVYSSLYLIQYSTLKRKKITKRLWRIPDLNKLDRWSFIYQTIAFPLLLVSLIMGINRALIELPEINWFDAKIIGSFIVLILSAVAFFLRVNNNYPPKKLAMINIIIFICILINFFIFSKISTFHFWTA